jgi:2-polyprenyl-3-methyl-5-hydroxy-6-metoxy-1,4-benzoquinol methylase
MQLISDEYRKLNKELHENNKHYGVSGVYYLDDILKIITALNTSDILDYGCGKGTLSMNLPFTIKQYDPAIKKHSKEPNPSDIVVCTDVLEHIEPEFLDNVLNHIASLTKKIAYVSACTREAKKTLPDGRNAHLIIKPFEWWEEKFKEFFNVKKTHCFEDQAIFILEPKDKKEIILHA